LKIIHRIKYIILSLFIFAGVVIVFSDAFGKTESHPPVFSIDFSNLNSVVRHEYNILQKPDEKQPDFDIIEPPTITEIIEIEEIIPDWVGKVNGFEINFQKLIERDENNKRLLALHEYFMEQEPSGKNEKTGIFEGYNLITISAEALNYYVIDPELTPTLYKMQHDGIYFEKFYGVYGGGTIAGELSLITGLSPGGGHRWCNNAAKKHLPFSFATQFNNLDIQPYAYHNGTYTFYDRNLFHPNLGYIFSARRHGLDFPRSDWHHSDTLLFELSLHRHTDMERFYIHYMTLCGHSPYSFEENGIARRNRDLVKHLRYSAKVQAYLATQLELEKAMVYLLEHLEEKGIAERTLIVMTSDHYPYGLNRSDVEELAGYRFDSVFGLHRNACIIYVKGMEPEIISAPAFTPDIVPTVLNLLGLDFDSRFLIGRDVFSDADVLTFFEGGFMTDLGYYDRRRSRFTTFDEETQLPDNYVSIIQQTVKDKKNAFEQTIELNYFDKISDYLKQPNEHKGTVPLCLFASQ